MTAPEGILLVDKPRGITSFGVVRLVRKRLGVRKVGHGGTLDPFATGVLVMLIGTRFTKCASTFLSDDKEYLALVRLGVSTDTYDCEGQITARSDIIPTHAEVEAAIARFQGALVQQAPMFSAKKVGGKRLYERARRNEVCARPVSQIEVSITLVRYAYPELELHIRCSKGTYIRSLGHDIGKKLGSEAHVGELKRLRSGRFRIESCIPGDWLSDSAHDLSSHLLCE